MTNYLLTLALTFATILIALLIFRYIRPPTYQIEATNIKWLLESALNGTATTVDWDVFTGMPIRQDLELDQIRCKCAMLASTEMSERHGLVVFTEYGQREITDLLQQIKQKIQISETNHD
jgi:hypothetical protein